MAKVRITVEHNNSYGTQWELNRLYKDGTLKLIETHPPVKKKVAAVAKKRVEN
jgi:hypothetical protein